MLLQADGEAGGGGVADQTIEMVEAGAGGQRRVFVDVTEDPQDGAQLDQSLLAHIVDGGQGAASPIGLAVHQVQCGVGLHVDDRDVVGDHVVEVAGDAEPFLAGAGAWPLPA